MRIRVGLVAALLGCASVPLSGQYRRCCEPQWPQRSVFVQAGVHYADFYGDEAAMLVALRANWQLRRWLVSELGGYYTRPENPGGEEANVFGTEIGLHAQLPKWRLRPYVGLATGVHVTLEPEGGSRFIAPSTQVMGGLKALLTSSLLMRAEARLKLDSHEGAPTHAKNVELTLGVGFRP